MTLLEELQSHKGGLLRIKTQLYWYDGGWDGAPGRVCLVLDAAILARSPAAAHAATSAAAEFCAVTALLLIDGCPHWVWVGPEDVEIL